MPAAIPRQLEPERMDDPDLPAPEHHAALRGLARINALSASAASLRGALLRAAAGNPSPRVLDVATGAADVAVSLARWGLSRGIRARFTLCDISATALEFAARRAARAGLPHQALRLDATRDLDSAGPFDLALCTLFLHHLERAQTVAVLGAMGRAARVVAVNDLRRCRHGVALAWAGSRLLTRSPVVHADAVISARAAWTIDELRALALEAGLSDVDVRPAWPCRMLLVARGTGGPA